MVDDVTQTVVDAVALQIDFFVSSFGDRRNDTYNVSFKLSFIFVLRVELQVHQTLGSIEIASKEN